LRLTPPCWLIVDDQAVEVVRREVREVNGAALLVYHCRTRGGPGQLVVRPHGPAPNLRIVWRQQGKRRRFLPTELMVFQR
jgi:hypothetical protein